VEPQDLEKLCQLLATDGAKLSVLASCVDGTVLESSLIQDILDFENPRYRRFKGVSMRASGTAGSASIDIGEDGSATAEFSISYANDAAALHLREELLGTFKEMRPGYHWLARFSIYEVAWAVIAALCVLVVLLIWFRRLVGPPFKASNETETVGTMLDGILVFQGWAIVLGVSVYPLERLRQWLFPRLLFAVGRQQRELERQKKWRGYLFAALILGVVASLIAGLILKYSAGG
jgi:hypothetical protein